MNHKVGLLPIARDDARVLILGSLPGDASLLVAQYYAHPRNHFWRLVSGVIGCELTTMDYQARIAALQSAGVALWDVIGEAHRPGSLDQQIRRARVNDLRALAVTLPKLRAVAFNGKTAARLAGNAFEGLSVDIVHLPSTSPAYTMSFATKNAAWATLTQYLNPLERASHAPI